jgi:hypothetical protein
MGLATLPAFLAFIEFAGVQFFFVTGFAFAPVSAV